MKQVYLPLLLFLLLTIPDKSFSNTNELNDIHESIDTELVVADNESISEDIHSEEHHSPPGWAVIPFVILLLMIATGPLFY